MLILIAAGSLLMTDPPDRPVPPAGSRLAPPGRSHRRLAGTADAATSCAAGGRVGQPWDEAMRAGLARETRRTVRVLRVGQPRTTDLREDRINVILDADGRVVEITCG